VILARMFISGIAGFLGSWLAESFIADGWDVVGADTLVGGYRSNVPKQARFVVGDCADLSLMRKLTRDCDVVFHCASYAYEGLSVFSPSTVAHSVFMTTASMASAAVSNGVGRFVLCSSMARYGAQRVPFKETMPPRPEDPYGAAKVASEELLRLVATVHGMEYVIAVPHNIYGPRQKYDDPFRNVVSIFANLMLQGRQPLIYGDGEQKRCFSYVRDMIPPLKQLATEPKLNGEIFNVGPDDEFITINQLARELADVIGFDLKPTHMEARPQEVKLANCDATKSRRMLGFSSEWKLKDGLRETVEWLRERGPRPFKYHIDVEIFNDSTPTVWKKRLL
jgi:UDP-glucose 4-epimerase